MHTSNKDLHWKNKKLGSVLLGECTCRDIEAFWTHMTLA